MKNLFFLFTLLSLLFACSDDSIDIQEDTSISDPLAAAQLEYEAYVATNGQPTIEYLSLSELNEFNKTHGFDQLTRDDFTQEQWTFLQNPDDFAQVRCTSGFTAFIGDMDGNGAFTTFDMFLAQVGVNQNIGVPNTLNVPIQYRYYGFFDFMAPYRGEDPDGDPEILRLDQDDIIVSQRVLLGILPCL